MPGDELLPCPFCGAPGVVLQSTGTDWHGHWMATCGSPMDVCPVDPFLYASDKPEGKQQAARLWNTRSPLPPATEEEVEKVARALCLEGCDPVECNREGGCISWEMYEPDARAALSAFIASRGKA